MANKAKYDHKADGGYVCGICRRPTVRVIRDGKITIWRHK